MNTAALLDVDGTLIDNNMLHVLAWLRAFRRMGYEIAASRILHTIGMGGDRLVPAILGEVDEETEERAEEYHALEYVEQRLIDHSVVLPGAARLIDALEERGIHVALASSARREELDRYLSLLGRASEVDAIVSKEKVPSTKPAPDIFAVALEELGHPAEALVVGDTVYDVKAASKLGLPSICVLTGGIERSLLEEAGAVAIYENAAEIVEDLERVLAMRAPARKAA